ncbi:DUF6318 family protein [Trujillonella endophytica]|uniref:Lipoprotein n=1 Tax=Trujillonella endophytica TaxID=673521 RepID=A0A1H8W1L4_9ACTN|nr:DUF6318 family protein [Trujillella endophytica]SEP21495.1 hypothetical protein SAMN05660991_03971 [Trujillella endophytica]
MAARLAGRTTAGAIALFVAVLSGCSEERPASGSLPSSTAETTSSEALPPLGPPDFPVPEAARQNSAEGALEFTRYYIALAAHVADGPQDPQPLLDLAQNCDQCQMIADSYGADRDAGYTYSDFTYTFEPAGPAIMRGPDAEVSFVFAQSELLVFDSSGQPVTGRSAPATGALASGARLVWNASEQSWNVSVLTIG